MIWTIAISGVSGLLFLLVFIYFLGRSTMYVEIQESLKGENLQEEETEKIFKQVLKNLEDKNVQKSTYSTQ